MSERNTFVRSLHDVGLAAWFGGTLMGAVGLNTAASHATLPSERLRLSAFGWARWTPVQLVAMIAHGIGGIGLIAGNKGRLATQPESRTNTIVKAGVTAAAIFTSIYAGWLGTRIGKHADEGAAGATVPGPTSSYELASAQRQDHILQWVTPALTGILVVLAAQQGEQQRPFAGLLRRGKRG